jgi:hypothetical protein
MKLSAFFVLIFCTDILIGTLLRKVYFKQSSGYDYLTKYSLEQTTADILIFGSSRAVNIYNPTLFEKQTGLSCYNAGRDGEPIFYHYAILQGVLKRYNPQIIVLSFDAGNFSINSDAYDRLAVLLPFYKNHPEIRSIVNLKGPYEKIKLLSSIYPYNSLVLPIIIGNTEYSKKKYFNINGFRPLKKFFKKELETFDYTRDTALDSIKVKTYKSFINDCIYNHIQLYIICPPYMIRPIGIDHSIVAGKKIAVEYNIPFLDYSRDSFFINKPQLFADYRHLNADGADYFTNEIIHRIVGDVPIK